MKSYISKIEAFDTKFFPDGVIFNLAPITLFGGSSDGLYLYESIRSLWMMAVTKHLYDLTKVNAYRNDGVFSVVYEDENAIDEYFASEVYCDGEKIDSHDVRMPIISDPRQLKLRACREEEGVEEEYQIKVTNVHWIASMFQDVDKHPRTQWQYITENIIKAKEENAQLLVDANSDITYNAVRILIKNGDINPKDVMVRYFAMDKKLGENGYCGDIITFDDKGIPSQMPDGFLSTYMEQIKQLL